MKYSICSISFLLVSFLKFTQAEESVDILKCCNDGFILNMSYNCIKSSVNFVEASRKTQDVKTQQSNFNISGYKKPACDTKLEQHEVNKRNAIISSGGASSYKYKDEFKRDDVCFDILEEETGVQKFIFLSCDPCKENACVNLCCPHGQAYKDNLDVEEEKKHRCDPDPGIQKRCLSHNDEELIWREELWDGETVFSNEKRKDVLFVSASGSFKCNGKKSLVPAEFLFGPHNTRLQKEGPLHVLLEDAEQNKTNRIIYNSSDFCLSFTDIPEYEDYYEDESTLETSTILPSKIRALYSVCYEVEAEKGEEFTSVFYPIAVFISCFFILVTIIIYCMLQDLRSNLFGKITLGFLCNVFYCYLFLGISYTLDLQGDKHYLNTGYCIFLAYIIHHTFIAFFFWTSAMAINITHKFSNILVSSHGENQKKSLTLNILYAQGLPILITIVTALIDAYGSCDDLLPNMGKYTCFVGAEFDPSKMFVETPEFIYFYLIISVIMISNLICFIITGYFLSSHWSTVRNMQTSNGDNLWVHIMVLVKIFLIMGIPWTLDVISAAVAHQHGAGKTFEVRVALDILNLLTVGKLKLLLNYQICFAPQGLIIFLVLICKKTVFSKLRKKFSTVYQQNSNSSSKTQVESMNLRKFSTTSGISTISTLSGVSTKTARSEVISEEEEEEERGWKR